MAKLVLSDVSNLQNESTVVTTLTANNDAIEAAMENTLSRDGTTPNQMTASLDMNSQRIINLPEPVDDNDAARFVDIGDAPGYAEDAAASAAAALVSETSASASAAAAASSASTASTAATTATDAATLSTTNASVIVGDEYLFSTSTVMGDPGSTFARFDNATVASVTNLALSVNTNATGNPSIRSFLTTWDDVTNAVAKGHIIIRKLGTPATYVDFKITGTITDNTTWVQIPGAVVSSNGAWSASDRMSFQFTRSGADGSGTIAGNVGATDNRIVRTDGTGGVTIQNSAVTIDDSGNISGLGTMSVGAITGSSTISATTITTSGNIELGHASDTTLSRTGAGAIAVEGVGVALNSISLPHTASTIELGHATDTTLSRSSAGILAVEGVTVPLNSTSSVHTASTIELGNASDTTLSRSAAGKLAVEGVDVLQTNANATITAGFSVTPYNGGTVSSGTFTINPANGNYQYYTNNGAHTLAAPSSDCAVDILVTNGASAGATTISGFTQASGNQGDTLTTTNTSKFLWSVRRINGTSTTVIKALQ